MNSITTPQKSFVTKAVCKHTNHATRKKNKTAMLNNALTKTPNEVFNFSQKLK